MTKSTTLLQINPFDYSTFPYNGFVQILGKRGTGKTCFSRYIATQLDDCSEGIFICMCRTERVKREWRQWIPPLFCVDVSTDYLENLANKQNSLVERYEKLNKPFPPELHLTVIIDDGASDRAFMNSPIMRSLASNGRHLELRIILLVQYLIQIPAEIRSQFDLTIMLNTSNTKTISKVFDELVGCSNMRLFKTIVNAITVNHGAIVIDSRVNLGKLNTCCFFSRIEHFPIKVAQLGNPNSWNYSNRHFLDRSDEIDNKMNTIKNSSLSKLLNNNNCLFDDEELDDDEDVDEILSSLHQDSVFTDRHGKIVVRTTPFTHMKSKID